MTVTAKIASVPDTSKTGLTADLADKLWHQLGSRHVAIIELEVDEHSEDVDDKRTVKLAVTMLEPAVDAPVEDHLRELARTLYRRRAPEPALTEDIEPSLDQVLDRGRHLHDDGDDQE